MFGKRTQFRRQHTRGRSAPSVLPSRARRQAPAAPRSPRARLTAPSAPMRSSTCAAPRRRRATRKYFQTKSAIFNALMNSIDLSQLATMEQETAREEIRDIVAEIIALKSIIMSISEQEDLLERHLLAACWAIARSSRCSPRDDIADIMVNGSRSSCYIGGRQQGEALANVRFRDDAHLMNIVPSAS